MPPRATTPGGPRRPPTEGGRTPPGRARARARARIARDDAQWDGPTRASIGGREEPRAIDPLALNDVVLCWCSRDRSNSGFSTPLEGAAARKAASQHVVEGRAGHLGSCQPAGWCGTGWFRWGRGRLPRLGDAHAPDDAVGGWPRIHLRAADRIWDIRVWKDSWVGARIPDLQDSRKAGRVASSSATN